jgi:hypothetical protein
MNRNITGIYNINNQVVIIRFYKRGFYELSNYSFIIPEIPSEETVEQLKNEVFIKEDTLDISGDGLEMIHQFFMEDSLNSYAAWVKNETHLFYISISLQTKKWGEVVIKKATLKPIYFGEIEVIDKDFIKTKKDVFYLGKKIVGADALSFEKVANTHFYQDINNVYSYTLTDGLAIKEISHPRYFVPYLFYFADSEHIYHQSGWSNKIEIIEDRESSSGPLYHNVAEAVLKNTNITIKEYTTEKIEHSDDLRLFKTYAGVFKYFFPDADAKWNKKLSK